MGAFWFDDGIFIDQTIEAHDSILGAQIIGIEGHPIGPVLDSLATMLAQDNESINKAYLPGYLGLPEILHYFGFLPSDTQVTYQLKNQEKLLTMRFLSVLARGLQSHYIQKITSL